MVLPLASGDSSYFKDERCSRRRKYDYSTDSRRNGEGRDYPNFSTDRRCSPTSESTDFKCVKRRGYRSPERTHPSSATHRTIDINARDLAFLSSYRKKRNQSEAVSVEEKSRTRHHRSSRHRHSSRHKKRGRSSSVSRSSSADTDSSSMSSSKQRSASTTSSASECLSFSESSSSSSRRARRRSRKRKEREERKKKRKEKKSGLKSKDKKEKKKKEKKASKKSQPQWGQYGVLQECDMWNKRQEFQLWLMEIKNRSLEELLAWEEKSLFRDYMEDYNTATLPHEKFYNLEKWEREQREGTKQAQETALSACSATGSDFFNDEKRRREEIRAYRELKRHHEIRSTYQDMRDDVEKINAMRHQQRLQTEMSTLFRMGRVTEAQKIRERLRPDEKF